jgi:uncharacterized membrane protein
MASAGSRPAAISSSGRLDLEPAFQIGFTVTMTESTALGAQAPATKSHSFFWWLGIVGPILGLGLAISFLANTDWYLVFKTLHVFFAIVWLGGGSMITVLAWRANRAHDTAQLMQIGKQAEWLSNRIFVPSSLVVLVMGFVLMHKGQWGYDHFWTLFGLIGWFVSFAVGAFFLGPQAGRLGKLLETHGPDDPAVAARAERVINVARADVVFVLVIAIDMVAKPFFT